MSPAFARTRWVASHAASTCNHHTDCSMEAPEYGRPGNALFEVHERMGLLALALLTLCWTWPLVQKTQFLSSQILSGR